MGAKWRPIAPAPEQRLIAAMRDDVVDDRGTLHTTISLTHHAEWMLAQVLSPCLLPLVAIAALSCCLVTGAPAASLHGLDALGVQHWHAALEGLQLCHDVQLS